MLQTSEDLLNLAKAVGLIGVCVFICFATYYLAMILRQVFKIIKEMRDRFKKIDEAMVDLKEKFSHTAAYVSLATEGLKKLGQIAKEATEKHANKSKKSKK